MAERNPTHGTINGKITPEEAANDRKANAELDTRPNIHLTEALRALRKKG